MADSETPQVMLVGPALVPPGPAGSRGPFSHRLVVKLEKKSCRTAS
jgi:hypothetical protein